MEKLAMNKKWETFWLVSILLMSLLIRLPFLDVPLERDEGGYAYIAWRIEQGNIPYKDAFDNKPPGIYYIYWFIFKILGNKVSDIHLFMHLYTLIEVFLIYRLGMMLFNKQIGLVSAFIFSFISSEVGVLGFTANTEIFMLLPIIASILVLLSAIQKEKLGLFFICGILNGIAFMIKQVALFNFLFIFVFLLDKFLKDEQTQKITELVKTYFYLILGFIGVVIPIFLRTNGVGPTGSVLEM